MKNVLVLVYYFPPMGGSGVQRPLKFIKYLRNFGWNPIVVCPEPGIYPYFDESLERELQSMELEIHRVKANTIFHLSSRSSSNHPRFRVPDFIAKPTRRFLRLFMYPDNKKGWIQPAVDAGKEVISEKEISLIFSTAPPFSNHIAGKILSSQYELPLVLDYRDAWLHNHFMDGLFGWQKRIMRNMEKACLNEADLVTGLDDFMLKKMKESFHDVPFDTAVISHGYDPDDFREDGKPSLVKEKGKLNFLYSGLFYEQNQPDTFLEGLKIACDSGEIQKHDIHLHFQGGLDRRIQELLKAEGWQGSYTDLGYQPHSRAVLNLNHADVLWMISNFSEEHKQVKSGKLFEYLGSQKPILGLVHSGKEAQVLKKYGAGYQVPPNQPKAIASEITRIYNNWKAGSLPAPDSEFVQAYNRKKLTEQLAALFDRIYSQKL